MTASTKQYVFNTFFNYKSGKEREWADRRRDESIVYLKRLFENKARFSCVARDENNNALILRGCVNLNSPCRLEYAKGLLGKYSTCEPSYFGDMVNLCHNRQVAFGRWKRYR